SSKRRTARAKGVRHVLPTNGIASRSLPDAVDDCVRKIGIHSRRRVAAIPFRPACRERDRRVLEVHGQRRRLIDRKETNRVLAGVSIRSERSEGFLLHVPNKNETLQWRPRFHSLVHKSKSSSHDGDHDTQSTGRWILTSTALDTASGFAAK